MIDGQSVMFFFWEGSRRISPPPLENHDRPSSTYSAGDYIPTGKHALVQAAAELRQLAAERARKAELARERERDRHEAEIQHKKFTHDLVAWLSAEQICRFAGDV